MGESTVIPDFQSVMLPLLEVLANGEEMTMKRLTPVLTGRPAGARRAAAQPRLQHQV